MAKLDLTDITPVLEELYDPADMTENIQRANPLLGLMPHKTTGGGRYRHVQLLTARNQGRSASFAKAQANAKGSQRIAFDVPWRKSYQVAVIDGDVVDDAKGNRVMFVNHIETEMDGALANLRDDIGMNMFRNHGGARGKVASVASDVITLDDVESVAHFEVGMVLGASTDDGTGSGTDRTGTAEVTHVDRDLGKVTTDGGITGLVADDFLFADGDQGLKMAGLASWFPLVAPTSTPFFTVDRSVDTVRRAGVRYDGTGDTTAEAMVRLATRLRRNKMNNLPDICIVSPIREGELDIALEGRKRVVEFEAATGIGYTAIEVKTPAGNIKIISDPSCPGDLMYMLNTKSLCIETCGDMARVLEDDGTPFLRQGADDAYELRVKTRGNIQCNEPGSNGVASLA